MDSFLSGNKFRNVINLDALSEKDKENPDYYKLVMSIKIAQSVSIDKSRLIKAYRTRYGLRDLEEFQHITNKYGHDFPATLTHTPLIDRHVKVLEGTIDQTPLNYSVTSRDTDSLIDANTEKANHILRDIENHLIETIKENNNIVNSNRNQPIKDKIGEDILNKTLSKYNKNWKSELEKQSQAVLDSEIDSLGIRLETTRNFSDLATSGECYIWDKVHNDLRRNFERVSPLELFYIKNQNERWISKCDCIIRKRWMLISDVILQYGSKMKTDEIELLYKLYNYNSFNYYDTYVQFYTQGYVSDYDKFNDFTYNPSQQNSFSRFVLVQYVEWKSPNKVAKNKYRQDRYSGVRIGRDIYVDCYKDKYVQRSQDNPGYCSLSFEGILFDEYDNKGRSMFLDTKDLADDYDIYNFYLQNNIALSGNKVITIPTTAIPNEFGNTSTERLIQHQSYLRQGYNYINPAQDGANFSNYGAAIDMSLGQGIKIIIDILEMLEERASLITGVSRQAIGQVSSSDGKATTEMALTQTGLVTQKLFNTYYFFIRKVLTNVINNAKITYKTNKRSEYVLGETKELFTLSSKFFNSDFDVYLSDGDKDLKQLENFQQLAIKLADQKALSLIEGVNIFSSNSLTEVKETLLEGIEQQKQDMIAQLQQKLEQLQEENKKMQQALDKLNGDTINIEKSKLDLEKVKLDQENQFNSRKLEIEDENKKELLKLEKKRVELEQLQIQFSNKSIEVKNK